MTLCVKILKTSEEQRKFPWFQGAFSYDTSSLHTRYQVWLSLWYAKDNRNIRPCQCRVFSQE
jgi:hypothetical protein